MLSTLLQQLEIVLSSYAVASVSTTSGLDFRRGYDVVEWKLKEERIQFQTVEVSLPGPPNFYRLHHDLHNALHTFHWWYLASFFIGNDFGLPRRSCVLTSCILADTAGLFEESGLTGAELFLKYPVLQFTRNV